MPRTGGVYTPPAGTKATANTTILSAPYNSFVDDLTADANAARPITAGGTGATSASAARTAIGADNASNLVTGTLPNARLAGDYTFANLGLTGGIKTDTITTNTSQQVVINAGESVDFATGQTAEQIYLNAETGIVITTSPDNWVSGWAGRLTAVLKGDSITLAGNTVWHSGNTGAGKGNDADLLDGQHGAYYRDLANSTGTLPNARVSGAYDGITTLTAAMLRLTNVNDAAEDSTLHALQIGPTNGVNLRIDPNEILTVNNGVAGGPLFIQNGLNLGTSYLDIVYGGTGAGTAAAARTNLGTNDAANLTTGYVPVARVPHMGGPDGDGTTRISTRRDGASATGAADVGVNGTNLNLYFNVDGAVVFRVDANGEIVAGLMNANKLTGTLGNAQMNGNYSFANLTLSGGLSLAAASGINFANDDTLTYNDSTNTWTFSSDGAAGAAGIVAAGAFANAAGDRAVFDTRTISAGNGLTGGGDLSANRSVTLGTPGSLTATTANLVTSVSHTHDVDSAGIAAAGNAALAVGAIGTDAFLWNTVSETVNPGTTRAGSTLEYSNANGQTSGTSPAGTWRCMGYCFTGSGSPRSTLWRRIS